MRNQPKLRLVLCCVLLFSLALTLGVLSFYAGAPEEQAAAELVQDETYVPTVWLEHSDEVLRGKSFTVDICISFPRDGEGNVLGHGLTSLKLILDYDSSVMSLTTYPEDVLAVVRGEALSGLNFYYSNVEPIYGGDLKTDPLEFVWNGQDSVFTDGVLCSLCFSVKSTDDDAILTNWPLTLSYDPANTFYTTPHEDLYDYLGNPIPNGGEIRYQKVNALSSEIEVVRGAYKCTWKDYDGTILKDVEEGADDFLVFSASVSADPDDPVRTADYCYTYEFSGWSSSCTLTEADQFKPFVITAIYTLTPQPYTVYYYFGERDPETGEIDIAETEAYYYRYNRYHDEVVTEGEGYAVLAPQANVYGGTIMIPSRDHMDYVEDYYSISEWYVDITCETALAVDTVPEDTTGNFSLKLYAYKQHNEEIVPQNLEELYLSKFVSDVLVDGSDVTVTVSIERNFGLRSVGFTLDYDDTVLTLTDFNRCASVPEDVVIESTPGTEYAPYVIYMLKSDANFKYTGEVFTIKFTLDTDADTGTYPILLRYRDKVDVTRFYEEGTITGTSSILWYTDLVIRQGEVVVQEVAAPTKSADTYYFNAEEQQYAFAGSGDSAHYDIVTEDTHTAPGEYVVTVRLKSGDNVYRFWTAEEGRPTEDIDYDFVILKRSVTPPTDPGAYVYNTHEQTYAFALSTDSDYYTATGVFARTNVGTETITVALKYPEATYWDSDENATDPIEYTFKIVKYSVVRPTATTATYVFDNTEKEYRFSALGESGLYTVKEGTDKRTRSGEQQVVCVLNDKANYRWAEGDSEDLEFPFSVTKRKITQPATQVTNYVYDGEVKTFYMTDTAYYTVSQNTQTNAGEYQAKVTLIYPSDTYWAETDPVSSDPLYFDFVIAKAVVTPPTAMETVYTFDRAEHEYVFKSTGDTTLYHLSEETILKKTSSGATNVVCVLNDKANYRWADGDSEDLVFTFDILKRAITAPVANAFYQYTYTGVDQTFWMKDTDYYTVSNNVRKYAGTYSGEENGVKVALNYANDTYWKDSEPISSDPLYFDFVINKSEVTRPTAKTKKYYYTGSAQTYEFLSAEGLGTLYTVENDTQTNAYDSYAVTVSLIDKDNCAWKPKNTGDPLSVDDLTFYFTILPKPVAKPDLLREKGGSLKKYYFVDDETLIQAEFDRVLETDCYDVDGDSQIHAGTYTITFSLKNTEEVVNYCWNGDSSVADHTLTFKIEKKVVSSPIGEGGTEKVVGYNGQAQTYPFTNTDVIEENKDVYFTISYSAEQFKNAGDYYTTYSLIYPEDTYWDTGANDVADKSFKLTITKTSVMPPVLTNKKYQEGVTQNSGLEDTDEYEILSDEGGEHVGPYDVVLTLKDSNYEWADGPSLPLSRTFTYYIETNPNTWLVSPYVVPWTYGSEAEDRGGFATPKFGADTLEITYAPFGSTDYSSELPVDAGTYTVRFFVPHTEDYLTDLTYSIKFVVAQAEIDLADVSWQEDRTFTFSGEAQGIGLVGLPDSGVTVLYAGETATDHGDYIASVTITPTDSTNYKLVNLPELTCDYSIEPLEVTVLWSEAEYLFKKTAYEYPTASYEDVNGDLVTGLVVVMEEAEFRTSGTYHFSTHIEDGNYTVKAGTAERTYTIEKRSVTPPTDPGSYVYIAAPQTYSYVDSADKDYYYVSGNLTRTYVGKETITFALTDPDDTYWVGEGESNDPIAYTFEIVKATVTRPTASVLSYYFTGETLTYRFRESGDNALYHVEEDTDKRIHSGEQDVVCILNDKENYRWADGSSEDITFLFRVEKTAVAKPVEQSTDYTYDGTEQTFYMTDATYYTVSQNKQKNAGEYQVKVSLVYPSDTYWAETDPASSDPLDFDFVIAKASVVKPKPRTTEFTFNMDTQRFLFEDFDSDLYGVSEESDLRYDAGSQKVRLTLKDANNYHWQGESGADTYYDFIIAPKAVTKPTPTDTEYVYRGSAYEFALENIEDATYYQVDNRYRTAAGTYENEDAVKITLRDAKNSYWSDPEGSVAVLSYAFVIEKKTIVAPVAPATDYVYNRHEQEYVLTEVEADKAYYDLTGSFKRTNAGSQRIVAKLREPMNCEWDVGGSDDLYYTFTILPVLLSKPAPDETHFVCTGETQTYTVALGELYTVSGTSKATGGTTYVRIALNDKVNYAWDNGAEQASADDLLYPFTIEHVFDKQAILEEYFASPADCTHGAKYYYVCRCGEHGEETFEVGDPLGHDYRAEFKWELEENAEGKFYVVKYVDVTCLRCDYHEEMDATVRCTVTKNPGLSAGEKRYDALLEIEDRIFTDSRTVDIAPIGYEFRGPTWTEWVFTSGVAATTEAIFVRIDADGTETEIRLPAEGIFTDNGDDTYKITAEVLFNGAEYSKSDDLLKPTATFRVSEEEVDDTLCKVMPGSVIPLPEKPNREGFVFLKWQNAEGVSLFYTEEGYTPYVMNTEDVLFEAVWKETQEGKLIVFIANWEDAEIEIDGCTLMPEDDERAPATYEDGRFIFEDLSYGNYSIIVTYVVGDTTLTHTTGTILGEREKTVTVSLTKMKFNTKVEDPANTNASVENLENSVSQEEDPGALTDVTITLTIRETDEDVKEAIKEIVEEQEKDLVGISYITLEKTVVVLDEYGNPDSDPDTSALESSEDLVDITFPITQELYAALAQVRGSIENILVVKGDGTAVSFLTKLSKTAAVASDNEDECFYIEEEDGVPYVVVRTKSFSTTYGLCVGGAPVSTELKENDIEIELPDEWDYGTEVVPSITATYGDVVVIYRDKKLDGTQKEYSTLPTAPGEYTVIVSVAGTEVYQSAEAAKDFRINAIANPHAAEVTFKDLTVTYDSNPHRIQAEGLPEGATVTYYNNSQTEIGEYVVKAIIDFGEGYETVEKTAVLRIVEASAEESQRMIFPWILIAIACVLLLLLIILLLRGKKYKNELKNPENLSAVIFLGALSKAGLRALTISLIVLDVILLGLVIWRFFVNRRNKKKLEELREKRGEEEESSEAEEPTEEHSATQGNEPPAEE